MVASLLRRNEANRRDASPLGACSRPQIERASGAVTVKGTTSLIAQSAFVMNTSIKENILFGAEYDAARYAEVGDVGRSSAPEKNDLSCSLSRSTSFHLA